MRADRGHGVVTLPSFRGMEATQDWTRKKTEHSTACWDCYRCHRACDGTRPCKRCVDLDRAASCRDPAPDEKVLRKRKRSESKAKSNKRKRLFFIVDPQTFVTPKTPVINRKTCGVTSPSSFSTFASAPSLQPASDIFPKSLLLDRQFVCESATTSFGADPERQPHPVFSSVEAEQRFTQQLILDRPARCAYFTPRLQQIIGNVPPSVEDFIEEIRVETEEITNHQKRTDSVFQSLLVPDDMIHLTESFFKPFGLRDSAQVRTPKLSFHSCCG